MGPDLERVLDEMSQLADVSDEEILAALDQLERVGTRLHGTRDTLILRRALMEIRQRGQSDEADRLLDAKEVAARLGCSTDWVYRNKAQLPVVRQGRRVRFSSQGIDRMIRLGQRKSARSIQAKEGAR